jgi:hypothetical protein
MMTDVSHYIDHPQAEDEALRKRLYALALSMFDDERQPNIERLAAT